jgi:hypothetical protein
MTRAAKSSSGWMNCCTSFSLLRGHSRNFFTSPKRQRGRNVFPRWRFLKLQISTELAPKGPNKSAQGKAPRPGYRGQKRIQALKGRHKRSRGCAAPSGLGYGSVFYPRAALVADATCSALGCFVRPLRGKNRQVAQLQNWRFGLVYPVASDHSLQPMSRPLTSSCTCSKHSRGVENPIP